MSWENKFSSILRETEANLSKVKKKFSGTPVLHHDWKYRKLSPPMKRSSSLSDFTTPSLYQTGYMSVPLPKPTVTAPPYLSTIPDSVDMYHSNTDPASIQSLHNKLDQQNKLIDQLMQMVNKLENERHNYGEQIREIKGDLYQLGIRVSDIKSDPSIARRIDQIKRDLVGEIQNLQSELQLSQVKGDTIQIPGKQVQTLSRDISDVRHSLKDDIDMVRRDLDTLKSRIISVEMDMTSSIRGSQDRIDRASREQSLSLKSLNSNPSTLQTAAYQNLDKLQVDDLRATVRLLRDKVDSMERSMSNNVTPTVFSQTTSKQYSLSNGTRNEPRRFTADDFMMSKTSNGAMDLDDLTLSGDEESTDFEMFNDGHVKVKHKTKMELDLDNLDTDEDIDGGDLDLDELDLSEDDIENDLSDEL